jgi:hypothetical protein
MKLVIALLSLFSTLAPLGIAQAAGVQKSWQQELADINREQEQLNDLKNRYKASADRHDNNAMRLQFDSEFTLDARYERRLADQARLKQIEIELQIYELEQRKAQLLKAHPEATTP